MKEDEKGERWEDSPPVEWAKWAYEGEVGCVITENLLVQVEAQVCCLWLYVCCVVVL